MKIWAVWFSDCFSTSHSLFFFSSKTCWGLWIVVWTWAFFFLLGKLIWASKIKSSVLGPKSHKSIWAKFFFSNCRIFKGVKREKRARAHAAEAFATYPSRLSQTRTCLFSLQIITEKIEPESLENAEIRFLRTRLIHTYLWFMQIWLLFWNLVDFDIYVV